MIFKALICCFCIFLSGCGSLTKPLETGTATYTNSRYTQDRQPSGKTAPFITSASDCFANSAEATESLVILPAIQKILEAQNAIQAINVKADRQTAPTVLDVITGAFIWGCSYWDIAGTLIY